MADINNIPLSEAEEAERLAEQAVIRREKLQKLADEGHNPFVKVKYAVTHNSEAIKNNYEELEGKEVSLAGRLMSRRIMGKASFSQILTPLSKKIMIWAT